MTPARPRAAAPRLRARSITVILFSVALVALAALAAGVLLIDQVGDSILAARQRDAAESARDYFVEFAQDEGLTSLARALDRREHSQKHEAFRYALYSRSGELLGGVNLLPFEQLPDRGPARVSITSHGKVTPWQVVVQPIASGGALVAFEDLAERAAFRQALALGSGMALVVSLGAVLLASFWLNRLIYRRVESIEATASNIARGDLSARAVSEPGGDAFDRLGGAINVMLDRNEELLTGLRTVTDSLAHDLRSPLMRMKSALGRALEPGLDEAARSEAIGAAWDEADRALSTTSALMDIARAETGLSRDMFQTVDLTRLIADVAELFGPVLEDAGQTLHVAADDAQVSLPGHELLLRQAVGNILFNAARYAGDRARVTIGVSRTADGGARLVIADTGAGLSPEDRARVHERFVRGDPARTTPGSGLGLAIAAACAKLHRGSLSLEDNAPGLRVVLTLGGPDAPLAGQAALGSTPEAAPPSIQARRSGA